MKIKIKDGRELEFRDTLTIADARYLDIDKAQAIMVRIQKLMKEDPKQEIGITNEEKNFMIDLIEAVGQRLLVSPNIKLLDLSFSDISIIGITIMTAAMGNPSSPSKKL